MATPKLTTEEFIRKARARHGEKYDYTKAAYDGARTPLTIICPQHGEFRQQAADHTNGKGCRQCGIVRSSPPPFTREQFEIQARETHGDFYDYSKVVYLSYKKPIEIICPDHGTFTQLAGVHMRGNGCPVCRKGSLKRLYKRKTVGERFTDWVEESAQKHGGFYDYSKVKFANSKTPVEIVCPVHGSFYQSPNNHLNGGCRCPECAAATKLEKATKPHADWLVGFAEMHGVGVYDYSSASEITHCNQHVSITCSQHGEFRQQASVHLAGHGCPKCSNKQSDPEDELREWVRSLLPEGSVKPGLRSIIPPYELDIFIPDKKLALEFNGTYWHCDDHKEKLYHQRKSILCRDQGILLIHVYEYDWMLRKDACKQLIAGKLGIGERSLHARDLDVRAVGSCSEFLSANHFQGSLSSTVRYGLFEGETMVSLMTFGKPRYAKSHTWELLRFCSLPGLRVRGGAGKLFARFKREHLLPGESVISYARFDYSNGGVYDAIGMTFDGICAPDYAWVRQPNEVLRRQSTQKHKLPKLLGAKFDANKTEAENMKSARYKRIYSAGNLRYVYRHDKP